MQNSDMKTELKKFLQIKTTEDFNRQNQILNEMITDPTSIKQLLVLMENPEVHTLQQLMSILLKKSIAKTYIKLSPTEKNEIKQTLLVNFIIMSNRFSENILKRLSEGVGVICKLENIKMDQWPELQQAITQGLEFSDKNKTLKALCLLDSILEINHDYFSFEHGQAIYSRLTLLSGNPYNEELDSVYLLSLKLMAILGYELLENEMANQEKEQEIVKQLLLSIHTFMNYPKFVENNMLEIEKNLLFIFEGMCLSLNQFCHKWESSKEIVLDFVLSGSMITNPHFGIGLKSTGTDILMITLQKFKESFSKDKKDTSLFQKIFKIFFDIIVTEEKACIAQLAQNSPEYDEHQYSKEQRQANFIFGCFQVIANDYSYKSMYQLVKELFKSLNEFPRLQLNLLISVNEGFYAHISREFDVFFGFVFGKLTNGSYSEKVLALRSLSFFLENNTMKVIEKFSDLMNTLIMTVDQISSSGIDEKGAFIFDEVMIVLELLVENGESENVEVFGFNLLQKLTQFIQNKSLNLNIRKLALRVVSALLTSLTQKQLEEIYTGLMAVLAQSCLEDYLVSETLIAIGRLSHYHLKDYKDENKMLAIYEQTYSPFVKKAAHLCTNPKEITDYELLEGAYSSLYFAVMTLKRNSVKLISPKIVLLTVEYIESRAFIDEVQAPKSENEGNEEEEKKEDLAAYLSNLSYKSMLVAGMHLIGHSMEIIPDFILKESVDPAVTVTRIKELLMQQELDFNQDVRCQSFKAFSQMTVGLIEYCNTNLIQDFLNVFQDFAVYEETNIIINRYLGILNVWVEQLKTLIGKGKVMAQVFFTQNILLQISNCIISILRKQQDYLDPDVLSILCQLNETICSPLISSDYDTRLSSKYGQIKIFPKLSSRYVEFPQEFSKILLQFLETQFAVTFEPLTNFNEEMDILCIEELIGSLAELVNKLGFNLIQMIQIIMPNQLTKIIFNLAQLQDEGIDRNIAFLLGVIYMHMQSNIFGDKLGDSVSLLSSFYQKYSTNNAIKDNCLSSMCKLYLNPSLSNEVQNLLTKENLISQIETNVPLEGDPQESNFIWKILFQICQQDKEGTEMKIITNPRLLTFLLKTLVYDKARIDDQIFDWILALAKGASAQQALRNLTGSIDASSSAKLSLVLG